VASATRIARRDRPEASSRAARATAPAQLAPQAPKAFWNSRGLAAGRYWAAAPAEASRKAGVSVGSTQRSTCRPSHPARPSRPSSVLLRRLVPSGNRCGKQEAERATHRPRGPRPSPEHLGPLQHERVGSLAGGHPRTAPEGPQHPSEEGIELVHAASHADLQEPRVQIPGRLHHRRETRRFFRTEGHCRPAELEENPRLRGGRIADGVGKERRRHARKSVHADLLDERLHGRGGAPTQAHHLARVGVGRSTAQGLPRRAEPPERAGILPTQAPGGKALFQRKPLRHASEGNRRGEFHRFRQAQAQGPTAPAPVIQSAVTARSRRGGPRCCHQRPGSRLRHGVAAWLGPHGHPQGDDGIGLGESGAGRHALVHEGEHRTDGLHGASRSQAVAHRALDGGHGNLSRPVPEKGREALASAVSLDGVAVPWALTWSTSSARLRPSPGPGAWRAARLRLGLGRRGVKGVRAQPHALQGRQGTRAAGASRIAGFEDQKSGPLADDHARTVLVEGLGAVGAHDPQGVEPPHGERESASLAPARAQSHSPEATHSPASPRPPMMRCRRWPPKSSALRPRTGPPEHRRWWPADGWQRPAGMAPDGLRPVH